MKKKYYVFGIAAILVAVCLGLFMNRILNKNETSHEDEKNIGEEVLRDEEKEYEKSDALDNENINTASEDQEEKPVLIVMGGDYNGVEISNFETAFENFNGYYAYPREVTVGKFSEKFPEELQEILVYRNDNIEEGNDEWEQYKADYTIVEAESAGDIPFEEIAAACNSISTDMKMIDIDGDGENEYIVDGSMGTGHIRSVNVIKNVDGSWLQIGGSGIFSNEPLGEILEYGNRYYLFLVDNLSYWNDKAEPDWARIAASPIPGQESCWTAVRISREVTDYTPYVVYSDDTQGDIFPLSEKVDLEVFEEENTKKVEIESYSDSWHIEGYRLDLIRGWEGEYNNEDYKLVTATIYSRRAEIGDVVLTILKEDGNEMKIVKIYYLAANYDFQFEDR